MDKSQMNNKEIQGMVSIIIPAYNAEKWINRSINSALKQTYSKIEVVVVENGSIDKTTEILENINGISVFHSEKGVSNARNLGIEKSHGEYVFFLDADDWIEENAIEDMMNVSNKNTGLISARYYDDKPFENYRKKEYTRGDQEYIRKCLQNPTKRGNVTAVIFRRKDIIDNKLRFKTDLTYAEDSVFFFSYITLEPNIIDIELPIYHVYQNPNSTVRKTEEFKIDAYVQAASMVQAIISDFDRSLDNEIRAFQLTQLLVILVNKICNKKDNTWKIQKEKLNIVCNIEPFKTAINKIEIGHLSLFRKIIYKAMKMHMYTVVLLIVKIRVLQNRQRMNQEKFTMIKLLT